MPDLLINPFDANGYTMATMTQAVNKITNNYGRVRQLGLFALDPVTTRTVLVEETNGLITLLKSQPVGAPAPKAKHGKAKMRPFIIPHIPYEDRILPSDIQGQREPGSINPKTLESEMAKRLFSIRGSHAITEEFLMMGALKGIILDADGSTLCNLYNEFGVTQKNITFALASDTTKVTEKCREVLRHIEDNLLGDVMTGVRCLCGSGFFDALISHPNVEKFYMNYQQALELAGSNQDPRKGFTHGGITFEEYRATATDPTTGSARKFIGDDDAHFFPVGTMDTFKLHHAPANHMETVNTLGQPIYAWQTMDEKGRWVDVTSESNPLPLCRRPGLLVTGIKN